MRNLDRRELLAIFTGGVVGALIRLLCGELAAANPTGWPWVTFAVNLSGAFLLGYFITRLQERQPLSTYPRPLLGTGFCGAYTTFSTMQLELMRMVERHSYGLAGAYALISVLSGFCAVHLATALVRRVRSIR